MMVGSKGMMTVAYLEQPMVGRLDESMEMKLVVLLGVWKVETWGSQMVEPLVDRSVVMMVALKEETSGFQTVELKGVTMD
jgi:hypothetical protein